MNIYLFIYFLDIIIIIIIFRNSVLSILKLSGFLIYYKFIIKNKSTKKKSVVLK